MALKLFKLLKLLISFKYNINTIVLDFKLYFINIIIIFIRGRIPEIQSYKMNVLCTGNTFNSVDIIVPREVGPV